MAIKEVAPRGRAQLLSDAINTRRGSTASVNDENDMARANLTTSEALDDVLGRWGCVCCLLCVA